jgi:hypothetical protein
MPQFIPLKELRDRVWPLAVEQNIATDMTAVSLPILDISNKKPCAKFMLYYAVPSASKSPRPSQITRPYAVFTLDLISGELLNVENLLPEGEPKPLIGSGVKADIFNLPVDDRRKLQNLFFSRCDEAAQVYVDKKVSPHQADRLRDLMELFESLSEPPLAQDYEKHGKAFYSWLRENAKRIA